VYDVFYSFNILNTSFNIGFCITVKRLEQFWFVRYINVYYYYYYYIGCRRRRVAVLQKLPKYTIWRHNMVRSWRSYQACKSCWKIS
jgi:hypothetical protein